MKKKYLVVLVSALCILLTLGFAGCGSQEPAAEETQAQDAATKTLVVYFSATGNTEKVAQGIAQAADADIVAIEPAIPYEEADLTYDENCRANKEQADDTARPEIANTIDNIEQYDNIFIGFPIWQGTEPRIIDTFLETYDLSGKYVALFCTSEMTGIDDAAKRIKALAGEEVNWGETERFEPDTSQSVYDEWIKEDR